LEKCEHELPISRNQGFFFFIVYVDDLCLYCRIYWYMKNARLTEWWRLLITDHLPDTTSTVMVSILDTQLKILRFPDTFPWQGFQRSIAILATTLKAHNFLMRKLLRWKFSQGNCSTIRHSFQQNSSKKNPKIFFSQNFNISNFILFVEWV
jgi:hypothetical protein